MDMTIPDLTPAQAIRFRGFLQAAFEAARAHDGREGEACLQPLLEAETFIRERTVTPSAATEKAFAAAAGWTEEPAAIDEFLALADSSFKKRLADHDDCESVLALLEQAGAKILRGGADFIPTDPGHIKAGGMNAQDVKPPRFQPRLAWLVAGLRTIGVYSDDLVIHLRDKDERKMKTLPHILIEIPRLRKQVALCEQVGEVTFVADRLFELEMWEKLTKYQLKTLPGVTPVVLRDKHRWLERILESLRPADSTDLQEKKDLTRYLQKPARHKMPLSVDLIRQSLIACRDQETGDYPSSRSGLVIAGPLQARNWLAIDASIRLKLNGLTIQNCPFKGLRALKDHYKLNNDYSVADIVQSLIACRDEETGDYPSVESGLVVAGPLRGQNWTAIHGAIRMKSNGLTAENCPFKGLSVLKDHYKLNNNYTVADIVESLIACRDEETGDYPSAHSGIVTAGPLKGRNWTAINSAIRKKSNGLTVENCPFKGLGALKDHYKLNNNYTVADIVQSLIACRDPETGDYPVMRSGIVTAGPLQGQNWTAINSAIRMKSNGLTTENCPFKGLGVLKDHYKLNNNYTVADIVESLIACRDPETGDYPSQRSDLVIAGPLRGHKWPAIDSAMRLKLNGLTSESCPFKGLGALKKAWLEGTIQEALLVRQDPAVPVKSAAPPACKPA